MNARARPRPVWAGGVWTLAFALACAPIDVNSEVSLHPREAPIQQFGIEELRGRDHVVEFVQLGPRLLVEVREHRRCSAARHVPVLRVETIERSNRGFVAWDFGLGAFFAAFGGLAFARPQLFGERLIDGQGRVVYDNSAAYVVGGVFTAVAAGLIAAGIVDAIRSRDETRYAEAFEVEHGPEGACSGEDSRGRAVAERAVRLELPGEVELEAQTDGEGRARFALPETVTDADASVTAADGTIPALLVIDGAEPALTLRLRIPFAGMADAHTGVVDTRRPAPASGIELDQPVTGRGRTIEAPPPEPAQPKPAPPEPAPIELAPIEGPNPKESP